MTLTPKQTAGITPDVLQMIDTTSIVGDAKFIHYPAFKVPGMKWLVAIRSGDAEPQPAQDFDDALKIATKALSEMRTRFSTLTAEDKT